MKRITANSKELMDQAAMTVSVYLDGIVSAVDDKFGKGFSKQHPEFIASLVRTAGNDFNMAILVGAIEDLEGEE